MKPAPLLLSIALLAAGCAHPGDPMTGSERLELYRAHAGGPVASFRIDRVGGANRWTPLGDQALAIWNTPVDGYLLELQARCPGLSFASAITLSNWSGVVSVGVDGVQPCAENGSAISQPCTIANAGALDGQALNTGKRELREMSVVERPHDGDG